MNYCVKFQFWFLIPSSIRTMSQLSVYRTDMIDHRHGSARSTLGIQYEEFVADRFVTVLLDAEHEWLRNAPETYGEDAGEVWAQDIVPRLVS